MKQVRLIWFFLLLPSLTIGQSEKQYLKSADKLYNAAAYSEAVPLYLTILQQRYDADLNLRLAECYRQMGDYTDAEYWYGIYVDQFPNDSQALFNYAQLLKINGKYRTAKEVFLQYAQSDPAGYYHAGTCDYAITHTDVFDNYLVQPLGINTTGSEIAPAFYNNGILFSSNGDLGMGTTKRKVDLASGMPFYTLYYVAESNTNFPASVQPLKDLNEGFNNAAVSYDSQLEQIFITRNNFLRNKLTRSKEKQVHLSIYSGFMEGLSVYKVRPFDWNSKEYSTGHPFIVPGGQLLIFVSDMPGGMGGTDIYYSTYSELGWSDPVNFGPPVNTAGNEMFPFLSSEGKLYFSSDYHPGFGGLDIFTSSRSNSSWEKPVNMGQPLNSSSDDFGLIIYEGNGYFSSNRPGGSGNDDLYTVAFLKPVSALQVVNSRLDAVADATVILFEGDHRIEAGFTNERGGIQLPVELGHTYTVRIEKEGYIETTLYDLDQYRSTTGSMQVNLMELYGIIDNQVDLINLDEPEDSIDSLIPEPVIDTVELIHSEIQTDPVLTEDANISYELFIGSFEQPDYTRITSLSRFGELSVRMNEQGNPAFYIIYLSKEDAAAALTAALAAGFREARVVRTRNGEPID